MPLTRNALFRQLATFHAVARLGSVSAAAEEMHLMQPAASLIYCARPAKKWRRCGVFASTLRAGTVTTAECLLPPLPVTFANQNPKVKVKLQVGNRDEIVRTLAGGSEMSSNEVVKKMCAPGFGVAILSLQTCLLRVGHVRRPAKNAGARAVAKNGRARTTARSFKAE